MKNIKVLIGEVIETVKSMDSAVVSETKMALLQSKIKKLEVEWDAQSYKDTSLSIRMPGQRAFDLLIDEIFVKVNQGISREGLIQFLMETFLSGKLAEGEGSAEHIQVKPDLVFWLETQKLASGGWLDYSGGDCIGVHPEHWKAFVEQNLPSLGHSSLLDFVIRQEKSIELQYFSQDLMGDYQDEFGLLTKKRLSLTGKGFWMSAIPLEAGDPSLPSRAMFFLFRNTGDKLQPKFQGGVLQLLRVVHFAALAYRFLLNRIDYLARQLKNNRSQVINELGPGILHHELGQGLDLLRTNYQSMDMDIELMHREYDHPVVNRMKARSPEIVEQLKSLYQVTDAFNNLERKHPTEHFSLSKVIEDALSVCHFRIVSAGLFVNFDKDEANLSLYSDAGLLLHLFINILTNACNACDGFQREDGQHKALFWRVQAYPDFVVLTLANNGPAIPLQDQERIFESGFTRRKEGQLQGHGQGLFLCKQIAEYLGGNIELVTADEKEPSITVGFRLVLRKKLPTQKEVG